MRLMLLFFSLIASCSNAISQPSVYNIHIDHRNGKSGDLSMVKGMTVVVLVQDASLCTKSYVLSFFDSLKAVKSSVALIVIPANDFDSVVTDTTQIKTLDTLDTGKLVILKTSGSRKVKAKKRSDLAQWLTASDQNSHFDLDISMAGNIYIINSSGEVRSVLQKPVLFSTISESIKNN